MPTKKTGKHFASAPATQRKRKAYENIYPWAAEERPISQKEKTRRKALLAQEELSKARSTARQKSLSRKRRKEALVIGIPVLIAVAAVLFFARAVENEASYELPQDGYQYYADNVFKLRKGEKIIPKEDGAVQYTDSSGAVTALSSLPIYYPQSTKIMLPHAMVYYDPRMDYETSLPILSEIYRSKSGGILAQHDEEEKSLRPGILFDGGDLYIFLEPVTVRFNGYSLMLPANSYCEASFSDEITLFNAETGESFSEIPEGVVLAVPEDEAYTVFLLSDSTVDYRSKKHLLFTNPDLLEDFF